MENLHNFHPVGLEPMLRHSIQDQRCHNCLSICLSIHPLSLPFPSSLYSLMKYLWLGTPCKTKIIHVSVLMELTAFGVRTDTNQANYAIQGRIIALLSIIRDRLKCRLWLSQGSLRRNDEWDEIPGSAHRDEIKAWVRVAWVKGERRAIPSTGIEFIASFSERGESLAHIRGDRRPMQAEEWGYSMGGDEAGEADRKLTRQSLLGHRHNFIFILN